MCVCVRVRIVCACNYVVNVLEPHKCTSGSRTPCMRKALSSPAHAGKTHSMYARVVGSDTQNDLAVSVGMSSA